MVERAVRYISVFLALLIVLPLHEFAHAFVAVKSGDYTPRACGRYTLNPLAHFDVLGLIMFVAAGFGWAKPVPVNPANFRHYRLDSFLVAVAGVVANYITAFLVLPLYYLSSDIPEFGLFTTVLQSTLNYVVMLSLVFFVFNLIPIFPLDGFRVVECFIKRRNKYYYNYKTYGIYVLYALILLSFIADFTGLYYLNVLGTVINFLVRYISVPITAFWGLIF
ncbi:MAG: site-2 protease family protein [Clostridia bacterium]|nr:site-2 protease family protein [Clostridia bacterium]